MGGLGLLMRRRAIQAHPTISEGGYILSADKGDAEVFRILMSKGISSDGVGITKEDAARVTDIGTWFSANTTIESFAELVYFVKVQTIVSNAFKNCSSLTTIDIGNVKTIASNAFAYTKITALDAPNAISIGASAFDKCSQLASVVLDFATSIGETAFRGCSSLTRLYAPYVQTIGFAAFESCPSLTTIDIGNVKTIANKAFPSSKITALDAPNAISIGVSAFDKCSQLASVVLDFATSIGETAFRGCSSLIRLNMPNVQTVGFAAFESCTALTIIDIGSNVKRIDSKAFAVCSAMQSFICRTATPPTLVSTNAFDNTNNCPIYVPDSAVDTYKGASNWSSLSARIKPLSEYSE